MSRSIRKRSNIVQPGRDPPNCIPWSVERSQLVLHPQKHTDLDLSGTLEDIDYRVVVQVLAEEGMNRSRTARRLGISRATLWRILGREGE